MKYELIGDIPDEFLKMVKINNTSKTIAEIKKELDSDYGSDLVNFESDLQIEIIDEVQDD